MTARLALAAKLDQKAAIALTSELLEHRGADLDLDAIETRHIGALAAQAIRSAVLTWTAAGNTLRLVNLSDACVEQLGLLGFTPEALLEGATA